MFTNILQVLRNSDDTEHTVEAALGVGLNYVSLFVSRSVMLRTLLVSCLSVINTELCSFGGFWFFLLY